MIIEMRLGITMRIVENRTYPEKRDAISSDWATFVTRILPSVSLVPLINKAEHVEVIMEDLRFDGVILSNGNDWGDAQDRDNTEKKIVEYCKINKIPVLGVCRGFQALNVLFGGSLEKNLAKSGKRDHVNHEHPIMIIENQFKGKVEKLDIIVNSYHNQGVTVDRLAVELNPFALSPDGVVEGLFHSKMALMGVQWHPERQNPSSDYNEYIIKRFFEEGKFWG